jgi:hypothetical protein
MKTRFLGAACGALAVLLIVPDVQASVVSFDEAVSGDAPGSITSAVPLTFGVGVNTITGTVSWPSSSLYADFDYFLVSVPSNLEIVGAVINLDHLIPSGSMDGRMFDGPTSGYPTLFHYSISTSGNIYTYQNATYPITNGDYLFNVFLSGADYINGVPTSPSFHYSWSFTVASTVVPVPATVWLFGSGLMGLIGVARRKAA